jgi:predicted Zn-dependent protease
LFSITDSAGLFINYLNDVVAERAFSRKLEEEADCVGLSLMATAGYDPRASLDLWELMKCVEEDAVNLGKSVNAENKFGFLRTHPTSDERLQALEKDMPGAMRLWRSHLPERVRVRMKREEKEEKDKGDKGDKGAIEASEEGRKERDAGDLKVVASADRAATQAQAQVDTRKHADTVVSPSDQERQV